MNIIQHLRQYLKLYAIVIGIIALVVGLTLLVKATLDVSSVGVSDWISNIDDPTERGFAYVSVAIIIHALVIALKTFTHDK